MNGLWIGVAAAWLGAAAPQAEPARPPDAPAPSTPPGPPADPALEKVLAAWDRRAADLRDLEVPFRQERSLRIRRGMQETGAGTFRLLRESEGKRRIRWDYERPRKRIEVVTPTELRTFEPDEPKPKVEVRDLEALGVAPESLEVLGQAAAALRKAYEVSLLAADPAVPGVQRVLLKPRDARMARYVAEIELLVDEARGLPRTVTMRGPVKNPGEAVPKRDVVAFHFTLDAAKVNQGLSPDLFVLAPPGVPVEKR